jgi:acyl-coenzyme A thioesterase PaaI-like protein
LSVEFKVNLLAPATNAAGDSLVAHAKVVRAGRTISVATCEVWAEPRKGERKMVALMQATMMRVEGRGAG